MRTRQRLIEMMVGIDQAREGDRISSTDGAVGAQPLRRTLPRLFDFSVFGVDERTAENGVLRIHEDQSMDVANEQGMRFARRCSHECFSVGRSRRRLESG